MAFEDFLNFFSTSKPADVPTPNDPSGQPSASASGGGGFDFGKLLMPALLGGGGALADMLLNRGVNKDISKATKRLRDVGGVSTGAGKQLVERAAAGKLTDPQQATVDRMKAEQNAKWGQYLSNLGIPVSSSMVEAQNLVDTQATELANKLINESFGQGLEAMKLGGSASEQLLQSALAQKKDMSQVIWQVAQEIGRILNEPDQQQQQQQVRTQEAPGWMAYGTETPEPYAGMITPGVAYT